MRYALLEFVVAALLWVIWHDSSTKLRYAPIIPLLLGIIIVMVEIYSRLR